MDGARVSLANTPGPRKVQDHNTQYQLYLIYQPISDISYKISEGNKVCSIEDLFQVWILLRFLGSANTIAVTKSALQVKPNFEF